VKRGLVVVAHADDAEFGCAGTVALWARDGYEVTYVVCTDSSRGSEDPTITREQLIALRKEEQAEAARILGVREVLYLGHEDGAVVDDEPLRRQIVRLIRAYKPERVIAMDPTVRIVDRYVNHPDHVAVASATIAAVYPFARNRPTFPDLLAEGLEPFSVPELWLTSFGQANTWVDIGETIALKVEALRAHRSQMRDWDPEPMVRDWAKRAGAGQLIDAAESFRVIRLT